MLEATLHPQLVKCSLKCSTKVDRIRDWARRQGETLWITSQSQNLFSKATFRRAWNMSISGFPTPKTENRPLAQCLSLAHSSISISATYMRWFWVDMCAHMATQTIHLWHSYDRVWRACRTRRRVGHVRCRRSNGMLLTYSRSQYPDTKFSTRVGADTAAMVSKVRYFEIRSMIYFNLF